MGKVTSPSTIRNLTARLCKKPLTREEAFVVRAGVGISYVLITVVTCVEVLHAKMFYRWCVPWNYLECYLLCMATVK